MSLTYKDDQSFFTTITPPFVHYGFLVKSWLSDTGAARYRYIRDKDLEFEFPNLQQMNEIYPDTKTIGVILNPWSRMGHAYKNLINLRSQPDNMYRINFDLFKLNSFDEFIESLLDDTILEPFWFKISTPQAEWFKDGDRTVDYLLRSEFIKDDFKPIQEYFCSDWPIAKEFVIHTHRELYNDRTKEIVREVFKEDIELCGYEF